MVKILNLDELAQAKKQFTLSGKTYTVKEMTVEEYVKRLKESEALKESENGKEQTDAEKTESAVKMILDSVEGIEASAIRGLNLNQLVKLIEFITSTPEDLEAKAKADADNSAPDAPGN